MIILLSISCGTEYGYSWRPYRLLGQAFFFGCSVLLRLQSIYMTLYVDTRLFLQGSATQYAHVTDAACRSQGTSGLVRKDADGELRVIA